MRKSIGWEKGGFVACFVLRKGRLWPRTCCVDQAGFRPTEILLPLLNEYWIRSVHHPALWFLWWLWWWFSTTKGGFLVPSHYPGLIYPVTHKSSLSGWQGDSPAQASIWKILIFQGRGGIKLNYLQKVHLLHFTTQAKPISEEERMLCSMDGINHSNLFFHVMHAGSPRLKSVEVCFLLSSASLAETVATWCPFCGTDWIGAASKSPHFNLIISVKTLNSDTVEFWSVWV